MDKLKVEIRFGYDNTFFSVCILGDNPNYRFDKAHNWVHHYLYCAALRAMRQKGAKVGKDPKIEKYYPILSQYHACGNWNGLEFKSEIHMGNFIFEFFQNVTPSENRNGGYYDFYKYSKFPYLIKIRLKLAINTLISAIEPLCDATITCVDLPRKSEERVLNGYQKSCHKIKNISSLSEAQSTLDNYDLSHNNNDRDNKKIFCGDLKYFYGYDGYLHRGIVYHNLNNMWYVIENDITLSNVSSFNLFDRTNEPIRRVLSSDDKLKKLKSERDKQIKEENFIRCNSIQNEINKIVNKTNNNYENKNGFRTNK